MSQRARTVSTVLASGMSAVTLFVIFRTAATVSSLAAIGVWALIQGLMSVSRIADVGIGANVTRQVAVAKADSRGLDVRRTAAAASIIGSLPVAVITGLAIFPVTAYVDSRYGGHDMATQDIQALVLASAITAALSSWATIQLAVMEGLGHLILKNRIVTASNVAGLIFIYPAVRYTGPAGIGSAYVVMAGFQLVCAMAFNHHLSKRYGIRDGLSLGQTIVRLRRGSGALLTIGMLRLSFEPTTKFLLSTTAPLPVIAAFELALRVSTQIRVLIQAGAQPLLVLGSREGFVASARQLAQFATADAQLRSVIIMLLALQIVSGPVISGLGLGSVDPTFLTFFLVLATANSINALGQTGYFLQLSSGNLSPLVRIHAQMAGLGIGLGCISAIFHWDVGVVVSYCALLSYGGVGLVGLLLPAIGFTARGYIRSVCTPRRMVGLLICMAVAASGYLLSMSGDAKLAEWLSLGAAAGLIALILMSVRARRLS
jgi:hypothetical protein